MMRFCLSTVLVVLLAALPMRAQSREQNVPSGWATPAEITDYRTTPRYDETRRFIKRLTDVSSLIRATSFGTSGQGRALPLVMAASGNAFTPEAARAQSKAIVLVQACIHAGEADGKDAGLALLRDIAFDKQKARLLDKVVLLFVPIYNADGHERFSPFNRLNQNGPEAMGWRANATNLNLNRDYIKADAPETKAWLRLWNNWQPHLFVDAHTTDGADFQYNVTHHYEAHDGVSEPVRRWMAEAFVKRVFPATEAQGNLLAPYIQLRDNRDVRQGMDLFIASPRFATGYVPLRNRPALLIETHSLKPYRSRVRGTYDLMVALLAELNRDAPSLIRAVDDSDRATIKAGETYQAAARTGVRFELTDEAVPFAFKGIEARLEPSEISGAMRLIYTGKTFETSIPFRRQVRASVEVAPPLAYVVPREWVEVSELLQLHGITVKRLSRDVETEVEQYKIRDLKFAAASFEQRVPVNFNVEVQRVRQTLKAGSCVVPMNQAAAAVAMNMLEPQAVDSLAAWGFFNSAFEQKEYGESYVLEKLAREMLVRDARLKQEFEQRLRTDKAFAENPRARLNFFFQRSPYFDARMTQYPVVRVVTALPRDALR